MGIVPAIHIMPGALLPDVPDEAFIEQYYEQAYTMCSLLIDDAQQALQIVTRAFRTLDPVPTVLTLYRQIVVALGRNPHVNLPLGQHRFSDNMAWLLKDVAGMRYAEIAQVLGLSFEEVQYAISGCRHSALDRLGD